MPDPCSGLTVEDDLDRAGTLAIEDGLESLAPVGERNRVRDHASQTEIGVGARRSIATLKLCGLPGNERSCP